MNAPFKPVARGPQQGSPPSLEFVALDRLNVDPAYQRATDGAHSRRIIVGMVKAWEWPLCQPLVVSRRLDGTLWVLDGQHRLSGARERGDIAHLPCVILPTLAIENEAKAFVHLNTRRQKLSQTDIFNGMLAAGDENSKQTAALIERSGWKIVRSTNTTAWKPGDLACAPMIADQRRINGEPLLEAALTTLRAAYPDKVVTTPATLIKALVQYLRGAASLSASNLKTVAACISAIEPNRWLGEGARLQAKEPSLTQVGAIARAISDACARRSEPAVALVARARPEAKHSVSLASPQASRFGTEGKGWCEQCEQLVSPTRAASCTSMFCKMQGDEE